MKKIVMICSLAAAFSLVSAPSFALVDGEVFGGYSFKGKFEEPSADKNVTVDGWGYGARAHLTGGFLVLDYGMGGFYQRKPLDFSLYDTSYSVVNNTYGFDAFFRLNIPLVFIKPYVRAGLAIADYNKVKQGSAKIDSDTEYFNSYYTGIGVGFSLPIPVVTLMVYGEYLYNHQIHAGKLTGNTFNLGISLGI